jgi:hypothetical protein
MQLHHVKTAGNIKLLGFNDKNICKIKKNYVTGLYHYQ